jgi:hypothetical protein
MYIRLVSSCPASVQVFCIQASLPREFQTMGGTDSEPATVRNDKSKQSLWYYENIDDEVTPEVSISLGSWGYISKVGLMSLDQSTVPRIY